MTRDVKQLIAATVIAALAALVFVGGLHCSPSAAPKADAGWHVVQVHAAYDAGTP